MIKFEISEFKISDRHFQVSKYWRGKLSGRQIYIKYKLDHYYDDEKKYLKQVSLYTDIIVFLMDTADEQLYFKAFTKFDVEYDQKKLGTRDTYELIKSHFDQINMNLNSTAIQNNRVGLVIEGQSIDPAGDGYAMAEKLADMMNEAIND